MALRRGDTPGSGCHAGCLHRQLVLAYRDERDRQHEVAVEASIGYQTEYEEYVAEHPLVTFKEWLKWNRNEDPPDEREVPDQEAPLP